MKHTRDRAILLYVLTSIASKVATVGLQFLAVPIAITRMDGAEFAQYTVLAGFLGFFSLADAGLGNAILAAFARESWPAARASLQRTLVSGIGAICGALALVWAVLIVALATGYPSIEGKVLGMFGADVAAGEIVVLALLPSISVLVSPIARAQAGMQQHYIGNLFGAAGNLGSFAGLMGLAWGGHGISAFALVAVMFAPPALAQLANAGFFLLRNQVRLPPSALSGRAMGALAGDGLRFFVPAFLAPWVTREVPRLVLFNQNDTTETNIYGTLMVLTTILGGFVAIYAQPLMPAVADAWARGDVAWVGRRFTWVARSFAVFSLALLLGFWAVGDVALQAFTRGHLSADRTTMAVFGFFLCITFWNSLGFSFFATTSKLRALVLWAVAEMLVCIPCIFALGSSSVMLTLVVVGAARLPMAVWWPWAMRRNLPGIDGKRSGTGLVQDSEVAGIVPLSVGLLDNLEPKPARSGPGQMR